MLSSFLYIFLNILLGVGSVFATIVTGSWIIGAILVLASKWRIFAVRPRFWLLNIKSSLVDLIVGFSLVLLTYYAGSTLSWVHLAYAVAYVLWLVVIKGLTSDRGILAQSIIAVFLGTCAATVAASTIDSSVMVALEFLIGFGASRHILVQGDEKNSTTLACVCGLIAAEVTWLCHSWMIIYTFGTLLVPQLAIILSIIAFLFYHIYNSATKNAGKVKFTDIRIALIFSVIVLAVIVIGFSNPRFNIF